MSLHVYSRPGISANTIPSNGPMFLLGHGAGGGHWRANHPFVQFALQYAPSVYSFELPLHGVNASREYGRPFNTHAEKQAYVAHEIRVTELLLGSIVKGRYVVLMAHSTNGILFTKLFHSLKINYGMHPQSLLINLGSALKIDSTQLAIQQFWAESSFTADPKRHRAMQALHRDPKLGKHQKDIVDDESWRNCVRFSGFASGVADSGLFTTREEQLALFCDPLTETTGDRVFFVQGAKDEPFPPEECIEDVLRELSATVGRDLVIERLFVLPNASHFAYFVPAKQPGGGLEPALKEVKRLIDTYGNKEFLQQSPSAPVASPRAQQQVASSPTSASYTSRISPRRILIIGSGVFGVSSARALMKKHPLAQIIILEQSATWPPSKGASQDNNRIVRPDYGSDQLYTQWALDSIEGWKKFNQKHGEQVYVGSGVLFLASKDAMYAPPKGENPSYEYSSSQTLQNAPFRLPLMPLQNGASPSPFSRHFPYWSNSQPHLSHGYFNPQGGYVDAARAITLEIEELMKIGGGRVELRLDSKVVQIETEALGMGASLLSSTSARRALGVTLASGEFLSGDLIVACAGAWNGTLIPELKTAVWPSAQPIIYVRANKNSLSENPHLTHVKSDPSRTHSSGEDGGNIYADFPSQSIHRGDLSVPSSVASAVSPSTLASLSSVPFPVFSFDLSRMGWYGFPADSTHGLVKIGHHGPGLVGPHTKDGPAGRRWLGKEQLVAFTDFLRTFMPHLYEHGELVEAKTCYYCDSFDGHWIMDYNPNVEGLFVATGGSGHAFKFLPVLPDILANLFDSPAYDSRFAWRVPSASTRLQLDVCRSSGIQPNTFSSPSPPANSRFVQSVETYLRATGQSNQPCHGEDILAAAGTAIKSRL